MTPEYADRIRGALLGLAWGDVLGTPLECWTADDIRAVYGRYARLPLRYPFKKINALDSLKTKYLRPLGLHTDDTQQALALLHVCAAPGGWSPEAWGDMLAEGLRRRAWRGYGKNFRKSVGALTRGESPRRCGSRSAGIGAAMRSGPLGALYRDDPAALARVALESSLVTHADLRAAAVAFAVAWAVAELLAGRPPAAVRAGLAAAVAREEQRWLQDAGAWELDRTEGDLVSRLAGPLFADFPADPAALRARIVALAKPHVTEPFPDAHPNRAFAVLGGLHALAMGLRDEGDPAGTLAELINQGHDTDTVGAICGSLLGARFGTAWFPRRRLTDHKRLTRYAEALVTRTGPTESREAFFTRERDLTRKEQDFQGGVVLPAEEGPWLPGF